MPAYVDHYSRITAFWTQKCACTPVDHWFARGVLTQNPKFADRMESLLAAIDHCDAGSPRLFLGANGFKHRFEDALQYDYFSVHFTRHPALRIVSAFLNKFVIYDRRYLDTFESLESFAKPVVQAIYAMHGWDLSKYRGIRFCDLLDYLLVTQEVDGHWATQIPQGITRADVEPDAIVHAERFTEDLAALNRKLEIEFMPARFNVTQFGDVTDSQENLASVFTLDLVEARVRVRPGNLLDLASVEKIARIYAGDFAYFGYQSGSLVI